MGGGGANSLNSPNGDKDDGKLDDPSISEGKEEAEWATPEVKDYTKYFEDFDISKATITEDDLIGSGSASNPYVVRSTKGFLYITNYEITGSLRAGSYFEIDCDIILNDEKFDENGNVSGGDGIVYNWKPIVNCGKASFDFKNHTIEGLYCQTESNSMLFGKNLYLTRIENCKVENCFVKGNLVCVLSCSVTNLNNSVIASGTIVSTGKNIAGAFATFTKNGKNLKNYATIIGRTGVGGICASVNANATIENCENYGKISGTYSSAGILSKSGQNTKIRNCKNYGDIYTEGYSSAGIVAGSGYGSHLIVENCENYGKIEATLGIEGGIASYIEEDADIINCKNYGDVLNTKGMSAQIVPSILTLNSNNDIVFKVVGCYSKTDRSIPLLHSALLNNENKIFVIVKNVEVVNNSKNDTAIISGGGFSSSPNLRLQIENVKANIKNDIKFYLMGNLNENTASIKNVLVYHNSTSLSGVRTICKGVVLSSEFMSKSSIILAGKNAKNYYGEDFSAFYVDFKSAQIGLKVLSGKGFYQGEVTENYLISKGFKKKAV